MLAFRQADSETSYASKPTSETERHNIWQVYSESKHPPSIPLWSTLKEVHHPAPDNSNKLGHPVIWIDESSLLHQFTQSSLNSTFRTQLDQSTSARSGPDRALRLNSEPRYSEL